MVFIGCYSGEVVFLRKCKVCGNSFTPKQDTQKYCSKECYKKAKRKHNKNKLKRWRSLGTSDFFGHAKKDFEKEEELVKQEKKRHGI